MREKAPPETSSTAGLPLPRTDHSRTHETNDGTEPSISLRGHVVYDFEVVGNLCVRLGQSAGVPSDVALAGGHPVEALRPPRFRDAGDFPVWFL
jgi:hypothetical protein